MNPNDIKDEKYFAIIEKTDKKLPVYDLSNRKYIPYGQGIDGIDHYMFELEKNLNQEELLKSLKENQWLVEIEIINERKAISRFIDIK